MVLLLLSTFFVTPQKLTQLLGDGGHGGDWRWQAKRKNQVFGALKVAVCDAQQLFLNMAIF